MDSRKVALIDQTNGGSVPPDTLEQWKDALQQQVNEHLAPAWNVRADICVLPAGAAIPQDTWPITIVDSLAGRAGVHTNNQLQPFAEVANDDQTSITVSHELLEMLVDPDGTRVIQGPDLDPYSGGQQVAYLVEVCDPCAVYSYEINGVQVSDFVLPSFYKWNATGDIDHAGFLKRPLTVSEGCYISWLDPTDYRWHEQQPDGTFYVGIKPGRSRDDRDGALRDANPTRHDVTAIYRAWPRAVMRRP
jgi:hypothetical protein